MEKARWVVGSEHDQILRQQLKAALRGCGFEVTQVGFGVAGSQELSQWLATSPEGNLDVEAETYIGLIVEGPADLVERAKLEFQREPR